MRFLLPLSVALLLGALRQAGAAPPSAYREAVYEVAEQRDVYFASGIACNPKHTAGSSPMPPPLPPTPECPRPTWVNLTLNVYSPQAKPPAGVLRPAFVATHSGGYATNAKEGYKNEMDAACRHFAARGYVAITMDYRLTNSDTGGGLGPANWSATASPLKPPSWQGGFDPAPRTVYPAVRDTKAAVRWLRANAERMAIDPAYVGGGGWSSGACTTVHLATSFEWDFTTEMTADTDPTFKTLRGNLGESSLIQAGVVWAGNSVVTDLKVHLDGRPRYLNSSAPLAMYRGSEDGTMTPWAQRDLQAHYNASGARCDLFAVPGVGHGTLFPGGNVTNSSGSIPVLNHSYNWLSAALGVQLL